MKTVIEMAKEAGFDKFYPFDSIPLRLNRFAELVRADERETCVKEADEQWVKNPNYSGGDAIRARGDK